MMPRVQAGASLAAAAPADGLFAAWCGAGGDGPSATADLAALEKAPPPTGVAPWFGAEAGGEWARELAADLADDADRARLDADLQGLRRGDAQVVVTGQQPGFLGGPLYTLHKIAAAVALARDLSAAGRPTVPVFWSGDDDDDQVEALEAAAWSPDGGLVRSESRAAVRRQRGGRRLVGRLGAAEHQEAALTWLAATRSLPGDPAAPRDLWHEARDAGWTWGRLQRRALLRVFAGTGLLVVSGDDPRLHRAAAPLYARILAGREDIAAAVRRRGDELAAAGWPAVIGERSTARPLYTVAGDRRRALEGPAPDDCGLLRPGVVLRSAVQDWLLRPRAVVVGPGEHAYLRQLTGVYAHLGLERSPLVPRLFAWLLPEGFDRNLLARLAATAGGGRADLDGALARWQQESLEALRRLLGDGAGLPAARVQALSAGRLRRWRRGLEAMLRGEMSARAEAARPREPGWVFPDGQRQERVLAWGAARALWGPDLVPALLAAAGRHLAHGRRGDWRQWEITVTPPEDCR